MSNFLLWYWQHATRSIAKLNVRETSPASLRNQHYLMNNPPPPVPIPIKLACFISSKDPGKHNRKARTFVCIALSSPRWNILLLDKFLFSVNTKQYALGYLTAFGLIRFHTKPVAIQSNCWNLYFRAREMLHAISERVLCAPRQVDLMKLLVITVSIRSLKCSTWFCFKNWVSVRNLEILIIECFTCISFSCLHLI